MSHAFFHRQQKTPAVAVQAQAAATTTVFGGIDTSVLTSTDPSVTAFYAQLTPIERIAHTIAVEKLGTSYDVQRTHAYTKWLKTRKE
jgi:hypothetical protein